MNASRSSVIDQNTENSLRGRFARVAIQIDLAKPLKDRVRLNNRWYRAEYEGIPMICTACAHVGHTRNRCPNVERPVQQAANETTDDEDQVPEPRRNTTTVDATDNKVGKWINVKPVRRNNGNRFDSRANRPNQRNNRRGAEGGNRNTTAGQSSRFVELADLENEDDGAVVVPSEEANTALAAGGVGTQGKRQQEAKGNVFRYKEKKKKGAKKKELTMVGPLDHRLDGATLESEGADRRAKVRKMKENQALQDLA